MNRKEKLEKKLYSKGLNEKEFNELIRIDREDKRIIKWNERKGIKWA